MNEITILKVFLSLCHKFQYLRYPFFIGFLFCLTTFHGLALSPDGFDQSSCAGFIENKGQVVDQNGCTNKAVRYLLNMPGFNVQIRENGFSYDIYEKVNKKDTSQNSTIAFHRIDYIFLNTNFDCNIIACDPSPAYLNFYSSGCGPDGVVNVRQYDKIILKNLYPNIDLVFSIDAEKGFEYDYVINEGADINQIRCKIEGAPVCIKPAKLIIKTRFGEVLEKIPCSYLNGDTREKIVVTRYKKISANIFSLSCPEYRKGSSKLLVDPVPTRRWGTYFGGSLMETVGVLHNSCLDKQENLFIAGNTNSPTNIATSGAYQTTLQFTDAFLAKFSPSGSLIWATYFGGPAWEGPSSVGCDQNSNVFLCGNTNSSSNIATPGAYQTTLMGNTDAFVAKFNSNGQRIWSTYFGGPGSETAIICNVGLTGSLYVTGYTDSETNIATPGSCQPVFGGNQDCFLVKFSNSGIRLWSTYYGGENYDGNGSCTCDQADNVYLCGNTLSFTGIATPGSFKPDLSGGSDGFIVDFDSNGVRKWGTYYGGEGVDDLVDICSDSLGNCFFIGRTHSVTGIATQGAYQNSLINGESICIGEFDSTGQRIWGSYYGGENLSPQSISSDPDSNHIFLSGLCKDNLSISTLVSPGAYQSTYSGGTYDGFFAKFTGDGQRVWGSLFGGPDYEYYLSILPDRSNNIYLTGETQSQTQIATRDGFNPTFQGWTDAFVVKFADCWSPDTANLIMGPPAVCEFTNGLIYSIDSIPYASSYQWRTSANLNIVSGQGTDSITVNALSGGTTDTITIFGINSCGQGLEKYLLINIKSRPTAISLLGVDSVCSGIPATFTTNPGKSNYTWNWSTGGALISGGSATDSAITLSWNTSGIHWVSVNYDDTNGCSAIDPVVHQIVITGDSTVDITIQSSANNLCAGTLVTFTATPVNGGVSPQYQWQVNGINAGTNNPGFTYTPSNGDLVTCILTSSETVCISNNPATSNAITMVVNPNLPVSVSVSATADTVCAGTPVTFTATPVNDGVSPVYQWQVNGINTGANSPNFMYTPSNGDIVICILTSSEICTTNNPANSIPFTVTVKPYLPVSITVTPSENPFCPGSSVIFTTTSTNGGVSPNYQWQVNGVNAGTNNPNLTYSPANGDLVTCILTSSELCTTNNPAAGNIIAMQENTSLPAGVAITATPNPFCPGTSVTFSASPVNGGTAPAYQWKVNGVNTGTNTSSFIYTPSDNDSISCLLTSNLACVLNNPVYSNRIVMNTSAVPVVSFTPCFDTVTATNAQPIKLKGGIPLGGTYSGAGVTGNVYYPSVAGTGTHTITYSYTNTALCSATATLTIHQMASSSILCGQPFTDIRDGAVYQTISLGSQCWMAEDLHYGNKILSSLHQSDNCRPEKYTHPESVYQWDELMAYDPTPAGQGLCPPGWHVPTEADWNALFANWTNNGFAGSPLKYSGFSGFDAILSGARHHTVQWDYAGFAVFFWSSTAHGPFKAWAHGMNEADPSVSTYPAARSNAFSVRCVRDF